MAEFTIECPNHDLVWAWRNVPRHRQGDQWLKQFKHRRIAVRPTEPRVTRSDGVVMRPRIDYTDANALGSRGVMYRWTLPDGVYDVERPLVKGTVERFTIRVENGRVVAG